MRRVVSTVVGDTRDAFGVLLVCATLLLLGLRYAFEMSASATLVLTVVVAVVFWMTNVLDPTLVGLFVIGSVWLTQSAERALVGFTYPATWLVVFGIIMGEAVRSSGLSSRLERELYDLVVPTGQIADPERVYRKLIVALCVVGAVLAVAVPSAMVRVLMLAPLVDDIGGRFSQERARVGIFAAPLIATYYSGTGVLTGSLPNVVVADILANSGGVDVSWLEWFLAMFPLMGLARALLVAAVVARLCRPMGTDFDPPDSPRADVVDRSGRMTLLLLLGVGIWVTDAWHGLHPAFGAVVVVLLSLLPPVGILSSEALADVDVSVVLFVAAVFAIADGLTATGVAGQAAQTLLGTVPQPTSMAGSIVLAFGFTLVSMLFVEGVAAASILTPVLLESVPTPHATVVVMAEAVALGTYFFPYQSGVLIAMLGEDVVDTRQLVLLVSACSIASTVLLVPLQFALLILLS